MKDRPSPWRMAVVVATAAMLAAGCSNKSSDEPESVDLEPLSQIESPDTASPPSGSVTPSPSGLHFTTYDQSTRSVVTLDDDGSTLLVFDADRDGTEPRSVDLPGTAVDVVPVGDGTVLLPMDGQLARADLRSSEVDTTPITGTLLSAAVLDDGQFAVGDDRGTIHIVDPSTSESHTIDGLSSVGGLAATQFGLVALDRHQTSLTKINLDSDGLGLALRAGTGAARLATDKYGRILVTDAAGGELLVYSSDDLLLRQRFPIGAQPWAVTYDDKSNVVWVSTPADNEVVGYTLDTGIPVESGRFTTVKQPDSIVVDSDTGDLFVGSATGGGLQRIPTGAPA
ncbi:hypothetical protein QMK17_16645 [Rhodococcus sp. G-MC3]|uniref:hypothetical protein n=1 Tax=Rhodococcus sp. G-MC3 TaxID=3046209 RepID=UPI0024BA58D2|nr:hypothetical protein [Rhodococcus sp. G-MC3]MDJ0394955.1 hypothetical protein [Rhodococcus sp. G-MC3]